jgi:hypothetical protein
VKEADRRARIREYKEKPLPAGLFLVRNTRTGKLLIGSSLNLPGMLNRQKFQLELGSHPDSELQADWNALGPEAFEFDVLDQLKESDDPGSNQKKDLKTLQVLWLDKLSELGVDLYQQSRRGI